MQNHHTLRAYRGAQRLALQVYALIPRLPVEERFALGDQLRRAVTGISSNIAEGTGRFTPRDFSSYLDQALGSAREVESQLEHSLAAGLLSGRDCTRAIETSIAVQKMISSLIVTVRKTGGAQHGRRTSP
jgi:four helix bundle protein